MSPVLQQFLTLLVPVVVAILTVPLLTYIKKAITAIGNLPAPVQQLIALIIAWGLNELATVLGVTLPTSLGGFDSASVGTLFSAMLAYILHIAQQTSQVKATLASSTVVKGNVTVSPPVAK